MNRADWWSQPFPPEGAAASEGILRQLGVSDLDPLTVLIREAAQNSWDARQPEKRVQFAVHLSQPSAHVRRRWADLLLPEPEPPGNFGLSQLFNSPEFTVLTVSDKGTTGLGGPLRADLVTDTSPDFVNFVRSTGEPRDTEHGGGTYGFGKGIFFNLSKVGTVLIRTRCQWDGDVQTRLMASALAHSFGRKARRYTGRHWWGVTANDGVPDPLLDVHADEIADLLELPKRGPDELGTDIVVLAPNLGLRGSQDAEGALERRDPAEAARFLVSALLWNLWPKMVQLEGRPPAIGFTVTLNGEDLPVPDPSAVIRLRPFVDAYARLVEDGQVLHRLRPRTALGRYLDSEFMAPTRNYGHDVAAPFNGPAHHCALMRQAELVVSYRAGPVHPSQMLQYGAVFRSDLGVDHYFAEAEPPTHDAWIPEHLEADGRSIVRMALRRVDECQRAFVDAQGASASTAQVSQVPLGGLSSRLASLMPGVAGVGGAASVGKRSRRRGQPSRSLIRQLTTPHLEEYSGRMCVVTDVEVLPTDVPIRLEAIASVALDAGSELEAPAGASSPEVLEIRALESDLQGQGSIMVVPPDASGRFRVTVLPVPGTVTRVKVRGNFETRPEGGESP